LDERAAKTGGLVFVEFAILAEDDLQFQDACRTLDSPLLLDG
jgi:hypothetical protein